MFVINPQDPSINMIVWLFVVTDSNGNSVTVTIDEEYGAILRMVYRHSSRVRQVEMSNAGNAHGASDEELYASARHLTGMLTAYYQTPVVLADYMLSGSFAYYRVDYHDGDAIIPMYGVIRAASFSMNERV